MINHSNLEFESFDFLLTQLFWADTTITTQAALTFPLFQPEGAVTFPSSNLAPPPGAETLWAGGSCHCTADWPQALGFGFGPSITFANLSISLERNYTTTNRGKNLHLRQHSPGTWSTLPQRLPHQEELGSKVSSVKGMCWYPSFPSLKSNIKIPLFPFFKQSWDYLRGCSQ